MSDLSRYLTPAQLVEAVPFLGAAGGGESEDVRRRRGMRQLRYLIATADHNGLAACILRPSERRLVIDFDAFGRWLEGRRDAAA
jgi:hypothetical protein